MGMNDSKRRTYRVSAGPANGDTSTMHFNVDAHLTHDAYMQGTRQLSRMSPGLQVKRVEVVA